MPIYNLKLIGQKEVAKNTLQFDFEKPAGFSFKPGQYGGFTLINPIETDASGNTRRFSLVCAPHDDVLSVTMRIQQSAYKRVLKSLPKGSEVKFAGPTGNFILHDNLTQPAVFIAGGIGVTPFHSMIQDRTHQHSPQKMILFYGNQSEEDAAYLKEFRDLEQENPNFKLIAVLANPSETWQGEKGYISYQLIKQHTNDLIAPVFYICGSASMVNALYETLNELGIQKEQIKIEDFPGY